MLGGSVITGGTTEVSELTSLLSVISDPKTAQERLAALTAKAEESTKALQDAKAANAQAEARWNDIKQKELEIDNKTAEVAKREGGLNDRESSLNKRLDTLVDRENAADAREKELVEREQAVTARAQEASSKILAEKAAHTASLFAMRKVADDHVKAKHAEAADIIQDANEKAAKADALLAEAQAKHEAAALRESDLHQKISKLKELIQ